MKITLLCTILFLAFINVKAQTADDIINKWMIAMGGKEKLASINTVYTENEVNIMNNPAISRRDAGLSLKCKGILSGFDQFKQLSGFSVNFNSC